MTPERRREIAQMGGKAIPAEKRSFSRNRDLAREAGRKGGKALKHRKSLTNSESVANSDVAELKPAS